MKPIFVGGCGRSGTTLLASLLAGHSRVVAPPESQFLVEGIAAARRSGDGGGDAFAALVRGSWRFGLWGLPSSLPGELAAEGAGPSEIMAGLARAYAERGATPGAERWVDHTPMNIGFASTLLAEFEGAPMIHIVRDPRAVIASVLPLDWGPATARAGARWWLSVIAMGLAAEAAFPGRVVRVGYEELVRDPAGTLERLCAQLDLELEPAMAGGGEVGLPSYTHGQHALVGRAPDPARIEGWRQKLSAAEVATIEAEVRDVPTMLGYELDGEAPVIGAPSSPGEFISGTLRTARQRLRHRSRVRRAARGDGSSR